MFGFMDPQNFAREQERARRRVSDLRVRIHSLRQELQQAERELVEMEQLAEYVPMTAAEAAERNRPAPKATGSKA